MEHIEGDREISRDAFEGIGRGPIDPEVVTQIQARLWEVAGRVPALQDAIFLRHLARDVLPGLFLWRRALSFTAC